MGAFTRRFSTRIGGIVFLTAAYQTASYRYQQDRKASHGNLLWHGGGEKAAAGQSVDSPPQEWTRGEAPSACLPRPRSRAEVWQSVAETAASTVPPLATSSKVKVDDDDKEPVQGYDLVVIGGGALGLYAALDAATRNLDQSKAPESRRRLKVAIFEADDFGAGWSSKTPRLLDGGHRFMERGYKMRDRRFINEAMNITAELRHWSTVAPWALQPIFTLVPSNNPIDSLSMGFNKYYSSFLRALFVGSPKHNLPRSMDPTATGAGFGGTFASLWQGVITPNSDYTGDETEERSGNVSWMTGHSFRDFLIDDTGVVIQLARVAEAFGADVVNHAKVTGLLLTDPIAPVDSTKINRREHNPNIHNKNTNERRVCGVQVEDQLTKKTLEVPASQVINTTGAYVDEVKKFVSNAGYVADKPAYVDRATSVKRGTMVVSSAVVPTKSLLEAGLLPEGANPFTRWMVPRTQKVGSMSLQITPYKQAGYHLVGAWKSIGVDAQAMTDVDAQSTGPGLVNSNILQEHIQMQRALKTFNLDFAVSEAKSVVSCVLPMLVDEKKLGATHRASLYERAVQHGTSGLISALGGNWATSRVFAEELVDLAICRTLAHQQEAREAKKAAAASAAASSAGDADISALVGGQAEEEPQGVSEWFKHKRRERKLAKEREANELSCRTHRVQEEVSLLNTDEPRYTPPLHWKMEVVKSDYPCNTRMVGLAAPGRSANSNTDQAAPTLDTLTGEHIQTYVRDQYALTALDVLQRRTTILALQASELKEGNWQGLDRVVTMMRQELQWDTRRAARETGVVKALVEEILAVKPVIPGAQTR